MDAPSPSTTQDLCVEILRLRETLEQAAEANTQIFKTLQDSRRKEQLLENHIAAMPGGIEQIRALERLHEHAQLLKKKN